MGLTGAGASYHNQKPSRSVWVTVWRCKHEPDGSQRPCCSFAVLLGAHWLQSGAADDKPAVFLHDSLDGSRHAFSDAPAMVTIIYYSPHFIFTYL